MVWSAAFANDAGSFVKVLDVCVVVFDFLYDAAAFFHHVFGFNF